MTRGEQSYRSLRDLAQTASAYGEEADESPTTKDPSTLSILLQFDGEPFICPWSSNSCLRQMRPLEGRDMMVAIEHSSS